MRAHVFARRNIGLDQPVHREVASANRVVLADVARDIGELEGQPQVAGAVERVVVGGVDAHHDRHHATDDTGHVIAIAQQIGLAARAPLVGVEREAGDMIVDEAARGARIRVRPAPARRMPDRRWPARRARRRSGSGSCRAALRDRRRRFVRRHGPARRQGRRSGDTSYRAARPVRASACRRVCSQARTTCCRARLIRRRQRRWRHGRRWGSREPGSQLRRGHRERSSHVGDTPPSGLAARRAYRRRS